MLQVKNVLQVRSSHESVFVVPKSFLVFLNATFELRVAVDCAKVLLLKPGSIYYIIAGILRTGHSVLPQQPTARACRFLYGSEFVYQSDNILVVVHPSDKLLVNEGFVLPHAC